MTEYRVGVIGVPGRWSTEVLADAFQLRTGFRRVVEMERVTLNLPTGRLTHGDFDLGVLDALVLESVSTDLDSRTPEYMEMLRLAERFGVRVFSRPESFLRVINRLSCLVTLARSGVPLPPTVVTQDPKVVMRTLDGWGAAILKPMFSHNLANMVFLSDSKKSSETLENIRSFSADNPVMLLQKELDMTGRDFGFLFMGGQYQCCFARIGRSINADGSSSGSKGFTSFTPDPSLLEIARRAQAAFGLDQALVDIAHTPAGPVVLRVLPFGGFRGAREGAGLDAPAMFAEYIRDQLLS